MKPKLQLLIIFMLVACGIFAQATVRGVVTEVGTQQTLIGANIVVKGTSIGTITDFEGKYEIKIPEGTTTLIFSYIGFSPKEIEINGQNQINVELSEGKNLEEIVVVGYQEQKKADLTGSVAVVDIDAIGKSPYSSVIQSLQGRVAGVNVQQDGQPGEGRTRITVRGLTSLNNNTPLYVVDGVPTTESLSALNPNDIESIQVLKDAAAASIYGSRSAAGVIIITTKKGRKGKLSVDAGILNGLQTIGNQIQTLNATQWGEVQWIASKNAGLPPSHPLYGSGATPVINTSTLYTTPGGKQQYQFTEEGTNWSDAVYQNAGQQQYYVNLASGSDKGNVLFGMSYFNQDGLIKNTYYDRLTARINSSYKVTDWMTVGENLSVSQFNQVQIGSQQGQDGIPLDVIRQHPLLPIYAVDSTFAGKVSGLPDVRNMVSVLEKNKDNKSQSWRIFGNAYFEANLLDALAATREHHDLKFKTSFAVDMSNYYFRQFNAAFQEGTFDVQDNNLTNEYGIGLTKTFSNTLQYGYDNGNHNVTVLAGHEAIAYDYTFLRAFNSSFEIETPTFTYLSAASGTPTAAGGGSSYGLLSYFSRVDYAFMNKYLVSGTIRNDKTSRFNSSGYFPAASIGWKVTEEDFMAAVPVVSDLKIRASYGQQGNQTAGDFATLSIFGPNIGSSYYDLYGTNSEAAQGYAVLTKGNPNLKWETTAQTNIGFDASLFNYKIAITFDYYIKNTADILLGAPQIAATGEGANPVFNIAEVRNSGIDLNITHNYAHANGFELATTFQFTTFNNQVTSLGDGLAQIGNDGEEYIDAGGPSRYTVGQPMGVFYGYVVEGIFQTAEEAQNHPNQGGNAIGRLKYKDLNNDGVIDDLDRTYIGSSLPNWTGGLNLAAHYKGLSLSAFLYGSVGADIYNETRRYTDFAQFGNFNRGERILDAWSETNTGSSIPAPTRLNTNSEDRVSTYYIESGNYLRLRSLRLSYDLPKAITQDYANVNIYFESQNLITFTNYSGVDPEVPFSSNPNIPGIDLGVYPLPRTFLFGINIKL
jgi:TonB-dependent starch-binding outer membrane protein SusC